MGNELIGIHAQRSDAVIPSDVLAEAAEIAESRFRNRRYIRADQGEGRRNRWHGMAGSPLLGLGVARGVPSWVQVGVLAGAALVAVLVVVRWAVNRAGARSTAWDASVSARGPPWPVRVLLASVAAGVLALSGRVGAVGLPHSLPGVGYEPGRFGLLSGQPVTGKRERAVARMVTELDLDSLPTLDAGWRELMGLKRDAPWLRVLPAESLEELAAGEYGARVPDVYAVTLPDQRLVLVSGLMLEEVERMRALAALLAEQPDGRGQQRVAAMLAEFDAEAEVRAWLRGLLEHEVLEHLAGFSAGNEDGHEADRARLADKYTALRANHERLLTQGLEYLIQDLAWAFADRGCPVERDAGARDARAELRDRLPRVSELFDRWSATERDARNRLNRTPLLGQMLLATGEDDLAEMLALTARAMADPAARGQIRDQLDEWRLRSEALDLRAGRVLHRLWQIDPSPDLDETSEALVPTVRFLAKLIDQLHVRRQRLAQLAEELRDPPGPAAEVRQ